MEELWIIRGSYPVLWTIPVYVTWPKRGVEAPAFVAIPLLRIQQKAFDDFMLNFGRKVNGQWMVTRSALREIGTMAEPGTDPETCLCWERPRKDRRDPKAFEKNKDREEFLDALYQLGVGQSRDEVLFWWYVLCDHAFDWLINKRRPIDMYFIRLHPLPFRANWKEKIEYHRIDLSRTRKALNAPGRVLSFVQKGTMLAVTNENTIRTRVEIEHLPLWFKTIKRVENLRLERLNPVRYAEFIADSVRRALPTALRIYRVFKREKNSDYGEYVKGSVLGDYQIQRKKTYFTLTKWGTSKRYRNALFLVNRKKYRELDRKSKGLPPENGHVSEVPDIQPPEEDVRDGRGDG